MPVFIQSLHIFLSTGDGSLTFSTFHTEQILETLLTVRFTRINQKAVTAKVAATESAYEVVRMPTLSKSVDAILERRYVK